MFLKQKDEQEFVKKYGIFSTDLHGGNRNFRMNIIAPSKECVKKSIKKTITIKFRLSLSK